MGVMYAFFLKSKSKMTHRFRNSLSLHPRSRNALWRQVVSTISIFGCKDTKNVANNSNFCRISFNIFCFFSN